MEAQEREDETDKAALQRYENELADIKNKVERSSEKTLQYQKVKDDSERYVLCAEQRMCSNGAPRV